MNRNTSSGGRVVPQANNSSGGGGGFSRIIQAGIGAFTQVRADEARTKREYESEVIKSAGYATRKEVDREHFQNVMQDVDVKNQGIAASGGLRFTGMSATGFELEKTGNRGKTTTGKKGTPRKKAAAKKPAASGNATTATGTPENTASTGTKPPRKRAAKKAAAKPKATSTPVAGEQYNYAIDTDGMPAKSSAKPTTPGKGKK
jgi:hypothetical protein